jgi:heme exporter protein A
VSFSLRAGKALILRGPNGSGKTTLMRSVAGLQPALSGEIDGATDMVAYAGHADGLKAMLTVAENLSFWAAVYGESDITPALEAYALGPLADRLAGTLSAGQKRRAGLARLLVSGRPIWVLDEPTVSLDVDAVALFANVVRAHLGAGGMALLATHIDLGLDDAQVLDVTPLRAVINALHGASDEAFL